MFFNLFFSSTFDFMYLCGIILISLCSITIYYERQTTLKFFFLDILICNYKEIFFC